MEEILTGLDDLPARKGSLWRLPTSSMAGSRRGSSGDLRNLTPVAGIETEYNLADRSPSGTVTDGRGPWIGRHVVLPLAAGCSPASTTGEKGRLSARGDAWRVRKRTAVVDAVLAIADGISSSAAQVSLAWLRHRASLAPTALIRSPVLAHLPNWRNTCSLSNSSSMTRTIDIWMRSVRSSWHPTSGRYCGSEPRLRRDRSSSTPHRAVI